MNKIFKYYSVIWFILLLLFNVITFTSHNLPGVEKYTSSFWIGYVFITLSFVAQIICAYFALKDKDIKKTFYNISLVTTSYIGLILSFIFGGLCMIISPIPYWISVIICSIILSFNVISVIKAFAAMDIVNGIDESIKAKTFFVKSLTADAESLITYARSEDTKIECKKVYELMRYSDPMSNEALNSIEGQITVKFAELSEAVKNDDIGSVKTAAEAITILTKERNAKCRLLK